MKMVNGYNVDDKTVTYSDLALGVKLVKSKDSRGALNEGTLELKSNDSYMTLSQRATETFLSKPQDEKGLLEQGG